MKLHRVMLDVNENVSLPAWGAWIEIKLLSNLLRTLRSLPAWGAWIEITIISFAEAVWKSLPAWGAWIEIP